jgi:exosome complex exonuclease DIS3/RRP44
VVNPFVHSFLVHEYINTLDVPELIDTLANSNADSVEKDDSAVVYPEHLPDAELLEGIKTGRFYQGPLRQNLDNWLEAVVQTNTTTSNNKDIIGGEDILIKGRVNMNRAIDGDIVVAELLPKEQWEEPSTIFIDEDAPNVDQLDESAFWKTFFF